MCIAVETPLHDIAFKVIKPPGVWEFQTDRMGFSIAITAVPSEIGQAIFGCTTQVRRGRPGPGNGVGAYNKPTFRARTTLGRGTRRSQRYIPPLAHLYRDGFCSLQIGATYNLIRELDRYIMLFSDV